MGQSLSHLFFLDGTSTFIWGATKPATGRELMDNDNDIWQPATMSGAARRFLKTALSLLSLTLSF
jgi:hypothetical protein